MPFRMPTRSAERRAQDPVESEPERRRLNLSAYRGLTVVIALARS